jgi:hypothetical protein
MASRRNVTNRMVAKAAAARGLLPSTVTMAELDWIYDELREVVGNPVPDAPTNARTVTSPLGDDRMDKIVAIMEANIAALMD